VKEYFLRSKLVGANKVFGVEHPQMSTTICCASVSSKPDGPIVIVLDAILPESSDLRLGFNSSLTPFSS